MQDFPAINADCHMQCNPATACVNSISHHAGLGTACASILLTLKNTKNLPKTQTETDKAFLQVKSKANTIVALFSQLSEVQRVYAYLQLAKRFLFQCENQVVMYTLFLATCSYPVSYVAYCSCSGVTKCLCSLLRCIVWPHRS